MERRVEIWRWGSEGEGIIIENGGAGDRLIGGKIKEGKSGGKKRVIERGFKI